MYFNSLEIRKWQQFEHIDLELHERLTILTGANGCGKTTLLSLFAKHSGWHQQSLSTPKKDKSGIIKFYNRIFKGISEDTDNTIGNIHYSNNTKSSLTIPNYNTANYQLQIYNQQPVKSFYIPSHRSVFRYAPLGNIPTAKKDKQTAFQEVSNMKIQSHLGSYHGQ